MCECGVSGVKERREEGERRRGEQRAEEKAGISKPPFKKQRRGRRREDTEKRTEGDDRDEKWRDNTSKTQQQHTHECFFPTQKHRQDKDKNKDEGKDQRPKD